MLWDGIWGSGSKNLSELSVWRAMNVRRCIHLPPYWFASNIQGVQLRCLRQSKMVWSSVEQEVPKMGISSRIHTSEVDDKNIIVGYFRLNFRRNYWICRSSNVHFIRTYMVQPHKLLWYKRSSCTGYPANRRSCGSKHNKRTGQRQNVGRYSSGIRMNIEVGYELCGVWSLEFTCYMKEWR